MDLTPSGEDQKRSDELSWDEARKFAIECLLAIEQRRQDLADREAGDPGDRCPECAELGHSDCYEAGRRAGREDAARDIEVFGEGARGRAQQYAGELSICSRRSNDAVVDTYVKSASLARSGDARNVQCSNCRDTRGGPIGHETGECTWKPCNTAHQPRTPSGCDGEDSPEDQGEVFVAAIEAYEQANGPGWRGTTNPEERTDG